MDQLCAHVILLPVKSMHTSPICCSSQADKLALCTHKQTEHFPDIRDCFQSERQSPGSFTQKNIHSVVFLQVTSLHYMYNYYTTQQIIKKTLSPAISNASTAKRHQDFAASPHFSVEPNFSISLPASILGNYCCICKEIIFIRNVSVWLKYWKSTQGCKLCCGSLGLFNFMSRIIHPFIVLSTLPSSTHTHTQSQAGINLQTYHLCI